MSQAKQQAAEGILYTDMYQITMAQLYYRLGLHEKTAQFDHFFRSYPDYGVHKAGYCINAGLEWLLEWMAEVHITGEDIEFLRGQMGQTGSRLFGEDFLQWLHRNGTFDGITMQAIPEGRVIHPNTPITVVQGPLAIAQVLETPLLNHLNYQILIATKASRICEAGRGRPMLEFGLRRAQGRAANAGARAALIGGADFTSNVGISKVLGFPPKGTHAHSMVQAFIALGGSELDAFRAYADIYPDDCLLLVDTINTLESGIPNAITVFEELRRKGHKAVGIRLDSGDLAYLSIQAARMLNEAGFLDTAIVLSNQLDELTIWQIITQIEEEAPKYGVNADHLVNRLVYGVGTRLITSSGASALDGVYKLVAVCNNGQWTPAIKISDTLEKVPNPGHKRLWRFYDRRGMAIADVMGLEDEQPDAVPHTVLHHPTDHTAYRTISRADVSEIEPLLVEALHEGQPVYHHLSIEGMREQRRSDISRLDPGVRRLMNPHIYHVSLTERLWRYKQDLIAAVKDQADRSGEL
jgi:nicotinate phosphoribosyltransferase